LQKLSKVADGYKQMGTSKTVKMAAQAAGWVLRGQMSKLVAGESSLKSYWDVGQSFTVFEDRRNVVVGIPPNTPTALRAHNMDSIYQVATVAADLAQQSGEIEKKFLDTLSTVMK
jgi:hypothetical protein